MFHCINIILNSLISAFREYTLTSKHPHIIIHCYTLKKHICGFLPVPTVSVRDIRDHWNLHVFLCQIYHI